MPFSEHKPPPPKKKINWMGIYWVFIELLSCTWHCVECKGFTVELDSQSLPQRTRTRWHVQQRGSSKMVNKGTGTRQQSPGQLSFRHYFHLLHQTFFPDLVHRALHPGGWSVIATPCNCCPFFLASCCAWRAPLGNWRGENSEVIIFTPHSFPGKAIKN